MLSDEEMSELEFLAVYILGTFKFGSTSKVLCQVGFRELIERAKVDFSAF